MQDRVMRAGTGEYSIWDSFPVLSQQILWRFYRGTFWYTLVPSERISFSPLGRGKHLESIILLYTSNPRLFCASRPASFSCHHLLLSIPSILIEASSNPSLISSNPTSKTLLTATTPLLHRYWAQLSPTLITVHFQRLAFLLNSRCTKSPRSLN